MSRDINYPKFYSLFPWLRKLKTTLAGVAQGTEYQPVTSVAGLIPSPAHAWAAGQVPSGGSARGSQTLMSLSLSFSFPFPLSKNK